MKKTIFHEMHLKHNAKMVSFAGYEMPIQYSGGIIHEHKIVREKVGMFDVSHMGEFIIKGKDALSYVQKIAVNDASKLIPGKAQYSAMCYRGGGIVDDLLVYCLDNSYMLVVNGANIDKDFKWCEENTEGYDVELINATDETHLLAIQGPESLNTLQKLTDVIMKDIPFYNYTKGKLAGIDMIISRTGYTGELGFELYFHGSQSGAEHVWQEIIKAGGEFGLEPVGLGARDTLRLEKGFCLYGNDIDETTNPIEAGLGWITKVDKGDFNGKDVIKKVKEEKPKRRLAAFIMEGEKFIPRKGYKISIDGEEIGHVTSGNISPVLNKPIGMGYVGWDFKAPGTKINIEARGKQFPAEIVKLPFVS